MVSFLLSLNMGGLCLVMGIYVFVGALHLLAYTFGVTKLVYCCFSFNWFIGSLFRFLLVPNESEGVKVAGSSLGIGLYKKGEGVRLPY